MAINLFYRAGDLWTSTSDEFIGNDVQMDLEMQSSLWISITNQKDN